MIRFIHTADIHFGMENYGRIDTKTGIHSRLLDFVQAFNTCIDMAIEESVDFFLLLEMHTKHIILVKHNKKCY